MQHRLLKCDCSKSFWTASSNSRGSETAFWLWKRWIVVKHDCNGGIFLGKVCITCNKIPNIWWIEASCVSHQELPIGHRKTVLYIQCYSFAYSQSVTMLSLDPSQYGFYHDDDENLYPLLLNKVSLPENFSEYCNCLKWARGRACTCRLKNIACCMFCKCGSCVNDAKIQSELTSKHLFHFTYLKYYVYVLNLVFIHEDA